jgi:hypothetical protein
MKRFIVLLVVVAFLTLGIFSPRVSVEASTSVPAAPIPDVVTSNVIWLNQSVKTTIQDGTLGAVVWTGPNCFALDVPGGYDGVEDLVVFSRTIPPVASGVILKLEGSYLKVYFNHVPVVTLSWNNLSVDPKIKGIYSQYLFVGRVLRVDDTGAWESETSYCGCGADSTPVVKKSYFYKIYLTAAGEIPYDPPTGIPVVMATIIVPDYNVGDVKNLVGDYVYLSLTRGNYMYFWLPPGVG